MSSSNQMEVTVNQEELPRVTLVTYEQALDFINQLVEKTRGKPLTDPETTVVRGVWSDQNYEQMAQSSTYSLNYLQRGIATKLFNLLTEIFGEQIYKRNLRSFVENFLGGDGILAIKGSELPELHSFYGRTEELALLKELIKKQHCIALVGVAGIGKTTLAAKLLTDISEEPSPKFDHLIWKSVAYSPGIEELVTELLETLDPEFIPPVSTQAAITSLLKCLQKKRYLIVLDEFEILRQNTEQKLMDYQFFIRRLVEESHQSCFILTTRFLSEEFDEVLIRKKLFKSIKLQGLDASSAMQLLLEKGLTNYNKCQELIKIYRGNPSELETVSSRISHFFASEEVFFENPTTLISNRLEAMLNEIFRESLSNLDKEILNYLAEMIVVGKHPTFTNLLHDFNSKKAISISTLELIKNLEKLERIFLIETGKNPITKEFTITLQPSIKKYILSDPLGLARGSEPSNLKLAS